MDKRTQTKGAPMSPTFTDKLKLFDKLPDDAIVNDDTSAVLLGISTKTLRRTNPVPVKKISTRRQGRRVGDIRALVRGQSAAA
jgi:hypothetical protein